MSNMDEEDPYAVSSDSDDEEHKGPPPKIAIEGAADLNQLKQALAADEKKTVKDERTLEEIEELRRAKAEELSRVKREFEEGRAGAGQQLEGGHVQKETLEGVGKENLVSMKEMFAKGPAEFVRAGGTEIGDELAQLTSTLKEKKESWQSSVSSAQASGGSTALTPEELAAAGTVKGNAERFASGIDTSTPVDDEEKRRQLEEIKNQVSEVKQKWRTGDVEGAAIVQDDAAKREELEALKKGVNLRERFQPPGEGEVQRSYDRSELENSGAADARKSFLEGSAFAGAKAECAAAGELSELKFTELNAYKDKFERGQGDAEEIERAKVELDLQMHELKKAFEKPESEMSPEERAAKKKAEIEAEFARYKLARKLQAANKANEQAAADGEKELDVGGAGADAANRRATGGEDYGEEYDVKNLMQKFKNIDTESGPKGRERNLEELEALRMEAKKLREQFEQANQLESSEMSEEKRRQLEEEFKQLKEERERARKELEAEQAEAVAASAAGAGKEDIQVAADHASKMTAKWEKIHKKEAKKAEKGKMPSK